MSTKPAKSRVSRIPATLQAVFLASNRGKDVHKPPPKSVASRVFFGNWLFQRQSNSARNNRKSNTSSLNTKNEIRARDIHPVQATVPTASRRSLDSSGGSAKQLLSPQVYLDAMLRHRGYSTKRYKSLNSAYYSKPTPHQRASYDVHLIQVIRQRNAEAFRNIMSYGLSSNPCNQYSESVAHTVCRHGNVDMLEVLVERNCDFCVADDYGRTPLHDACWAAEPAFDVVKTILQADLRMFHMIDARGHCPLNYVRKEHYDEWIEFLDKHANELWPKRSVKDQGEQDAPPLTQQLPDSKPCVDPPDAFSLELASMVAAGRFKAEEARILHESEAATVAETITEEEYDDEDDLDDSDDEDDSEFDDSEYDSEYDSEEDEEMEEMAMLLRDLPALSQRVQ